MPDGNAEDGADIAYRCHDECPVSRRPTAEHARPTAENRQEGLRPALEPLDLLLLAADLRPQRLDLTLLRL